MGLPDETQDTQVHLSCGSTMHTLYSVKCVPDIAWDILTLKEHGCCSEAHMWLGVLYSVRQTPRRQQDERAGRNLPGHSASHSAVAEDGTGCRRWGKAAQRRRADCPGCRDTRGRTEGAARRARPSCWLCVVGQEGGPLRLGRLCWGLGFTSAGRQALWPAQRHSPGVINHTAVPA